MLQFKNKINKNKKLNCNNINIHKRKNINDIKINKKSLKSNKIKFNPVKKKNNIDENKGKFKINDVKKLKFQKDNRINLKKDKLNISNNNSDKNLSSDNNFNLENSLQNQVPSNILNLKNFSKSKKNSKQNMLIENNNFAPNIYIQSPIINIQKNFSKKEKFNLKNNKRVMNKNKKGILSNELNKIINPEINKEIESKLSQTYYDFQDLDYKEAIIYDKRSYFRIYWEFLVDSQLILGTFCTDNHLDLFVIKLSFFICTFQISFFLNALFYSDEYISDAYHNDGVLDFFSGLPKSIYSLIATLITTNLLRMLSSSKSELVHVIKDKRKYDNYVNIINNKLSKLSKKLILYFIIVYLLGTFFLYYVVVFCSVYRNSQKYWFIGCIESFGMDSLVGLISCIFLAFFRYISIKKHIKCFYILANILSTFL